MASTSSPPNSGASVPISIRRRPRADEQARLQPRAGGGKKLWSSSSSSASASASAAAGPSRDRAENAPTEPATKNVVVLGGSYGGMHAASVLAARLPPSHRVILIERNSHFNHLYVFPRFSVLPGHEHKAFIPYTSIFKDAPPRGAACAAAEKGKGKESAAAGEQAPAPPEAAKAPPPAPAAQAGSTAEKQAAARKGLLEFASSSLSSDGASAGADERPSARPASRLSRASSASTPASSPQPSSLASSLDGTAPSTAASTALSSLASSLVSSSHQQRRAEEAAKGEGAGEASAAHEQAQTQDLPVSLQEMEQGISHDAQDLAAARQREEASGERSTFVEVKRLGDVVEAPSSSSSAPSVTAAASASAAAAEERELEEELEKGEGQQAPANEVPRVDVEHGETGSPHLVLQATVTDITDSHVVVQPATSDDPLLDALTGRAGGGSGAREGTAAAAKRKLWEISSVSIPYSHLIYALGSHLPDPLRTDSRTKKDGVQWMKRIQARVEQASEIVLVGGGALGVEFATDIASVYKDSMLRPGEDPQTARDAHGRRKKSVTLIHSRKQLLPNFDPRVHDVALQRLQELGVNVVLGERLALTQGCPKGSSVSDVAEAVKRMPVSDADAKRFSNAKLLTDTRDHTISAADGQLERKIIRTTGGKVFTADLLMLCTGQQPNSGLMAKLSPSSVDPQTRLVRVLPTLQVAVPDPRDAAQMPFEMRPPCGDCDCFLDRKTAGADRSQGEAKREQLDGDGLPMKHRHHVEGLRNVYAIGDVADAFGAINAGYQAWGMADVAAENILRDLGVSSAPGADGEDAASSSSSSDNGDAASSGRSSALPELQEFDPAPTMLKLSLGLGKMVFQGGPVQDPAHPDAPPKPEITIKDDPHDLSVEGVWTFMAKASTDDLYV